MFTQETAYTAMCIWEAALDAADNSEHPLTQFRKHYGTHSAREIAASMAPFFDAVWEAGKSLAGDPDCWDAVTFDWEFVPHLAAALSWHGPTMPAPDDLPAAFAMARRMLAELVEIVA